MAVGPCVATPGDEEPHVDLDVEEDEGGKGKDSEKNCPGDVHVVFDVDRIVPKKSKKSLF